MSKTSIKGEVIAMLELKQGTSNGKTWSTQTIVVKETEETYPKTIAFDIFGEDKIKEADLSMGDIIAVEANVESREWNGKYFTSIKSWKVTKEGGVPKSEPIIAPREVNNTEEENSELPF